MKIKIVAIDKVLPYENNPRKNKKAISKVADSIREYGFQQPIVVDKQMVVIVGHTRLEAAISLQLKKVPVVVADKLTTHQARSYRIADNRTGEDSSWDLEKLGIELEKLDIANYDLSLTALNTLEIDKLLNPATRNRTTDPDATPEPPKNPVSAVGDVWIMGDHKLICGDSTDPETYVKLLGDDKADMVWTDPPYNIDYHSDAGASIMNDNMDDGAFMSLLVNAMKNALVHTADGGAVYVAHSESYSTSFRVAMDDAGWSIRQCLIWVKHHFTLSRQDYQWQHEPILYGWKATGPHHWHGNFSNSTIFDDAADLESMEKKDLVKLFQELRDEMTILREDKPAISKLHPTMKPVELVARMIKNSSGRNETILDPFGGSGTTLMACEKYTRRCVTIELDPCYADVIVNRWQDYTGQEAILESTGKAFGKAA